MCHASNPRDGACEPLIQTATRWRVMMLPKCVMLVFCHPTSEFVRMSRCSSNTMVASKDTRSYTGVGIC